MVFAKRKNAWEGLKRPFRARTPERVYRVDFVVADGQVVVRAAKTLKGLRGVVTAAGPGDFEAERSRAKAAVGKRVSEKMS